MANQPLKARNPETHKPTNMDHLATAPRTLLLPMQPVFPAHHARPRAPGPAALSQAPARPDPPTEAPDSRSRSAMGAGRGPSGLSPTALSRDGNRIRRGRVSAENYNSQQSSQLHSRFRTTAVRSPLRCRKAGGGRTTSPKMPSASSHVGKGRPENMRTGRALWFI